MSILIELYHPVSGEKLICFNESEKPLIVFALKELDIKTTSLHECGVIHD